MPQYRLRISNCSLWKLLLDLEVALEDLTRLLMPNKDEVNDLVKKVEKGKYSAEVPKQIQYVVDST